MVEASTADAVALNHYLVGALPERAHRTFERAAGGTATIKVPSSEPAEVMHATARDEIVAGIPTSVVPHESYHIFTSTGPTTLAPLGIDELGPLASLTEYISIYDALVIATHRTQNTDEIITNDPEIAAFGVDTVWD